jgi:hypothetical protein
MKVTFSSNKSVSNKRFIVPPIAFERPPSKDPKKDDVVTFKLRYDPESSQSQNYEVNVVMFKLGSPEEWLKHVVAVKKVIVGQNITDGPGMFRMMHRTIEADALAVFNQKAKDLKEETMNSFGECIKAVTTHVFPMRALAIQKRYMRRYMRKPQNVTTREFVARVVEINGMLADFPPFNTNQSLPDEELLDIFEFGIPANWQKHMIKLGFDPLQHTTSEFIDFCQRMEWTETEEGTKSKTSQNGSNGSTLMPKSSVEALKKTIKTKTNQSIVHCMMCMDMILENANSFWLRQRKCAASGKLRRLTEILSLLPLKRKMKPKARMNFMPWLTI